MIQKDINEIKYEVSKIDEKFHSGFLKKRDCFSQIEEYLNTSKHQSKICAIYGLRRTGKTTLLKQAAEALNSSEKSKALYIECFDGTDFYDVIKFIKEKIDEGYMYFFIDEITYTTGFSNIATILSDKFVDINGAKIVVTGTDSLGLLLSAKDKMYDRIDFVNTTYTTFAEYSRITGISTIDEYIRKGSILRTDAFDSRKSTMEFIETAIVDNIIHSLQKIEDTNSYLPVLTEKYSAEALKCEIERIINRYSQVRTYKAITSQFRSAPLGDARDTVLKHEKDGFDIISNLKYKDVNAKIAKILGCDKPSEIEDKDISKLYDYLYDIGVFESIPVYNSYTKEYPNEPLEMIVHPGLFHSNIKYTLQELQSDSSWIEASDNDKNILLIKAYESAMGKIMENIIIADLYHILCRQNGTKMNGENYKEDLFGENNSRWYVSKINKEINNRNHEADIIIFDKEKKETYLFEIKHSSKNVKEQSIHLENNDFINYIEENFGPIKGRAVLYNGQLDESSAIPRIPASQFLIEVYDCFREKKFSLENVLKNICSVNIGANIINTPAIDIPEEIDLY